MNRNRSNRRGAAVMLLTTMMTTVLIPMVGLAVDGAILYLIKVKCTAAADAAALAGARSLSSGMDLVSQKANAEQTATQFFAANFPAGFWRTTGLSVTAEAAETAMRTRTVTVSGSVQCPLYFMRLLGRNAQTVAVESQASRRDVNLVLVLDRSSSMGGAMGPMRTAARTFVGKFAEQRDNVGLIVFGGAATVAFPSPSPNGPQANFKTATPSVDTLISQTVGGGNTGMAQAVWLAYQELVKRNQPGALNLIVLFTDGLPNGIVADYNDSNSANNFLRTGHCNHRLDPAYPMIGFISQTSGFAATGNTNGIKKIDASTVGTVNESRLGSPTNAGCSYASAETDVRNDLTRFPPTDYYGNSLTGYRAVDLAAAITSPQQLGYASMNATDSAVQRIRANASLGVVIFAIGYHGGSEAPDETFMRRLANDPSSGDYDSTKPQGLYVKAPTTTQLEDAFNRIASEILRLAL